ncbi:protein yippee-like At4g27745 isoform X1 [Musa acuminata AAA Group]
MSLLARGFALGRHPSCRDQILPWQKKGGLDHLSESSLLCPVGRARRNGWAAFAMEGSVGPRVYSCSNCGNHVCLHDDIISKAFHVNPGRHGRAFLFSHGRNIVMGPKQDRLLMTGIHTVADVYCHDCGEVLGWKYERAYEETQRYKEGKFVFEKIKIVKENW